MHLTVLGNAGRYLAPLSGGSAYLVEADDTRILLDCGGGAREGLRGLDAPLDAVVLSHFHFDHVLDFPTIRDLLSEKTMVILPAGERKRLDALATAYVFQGEYDLPGQIVEAKDDLELVVGGARLRFAPTQHSAPSFATRIDGRDGSLVYASDTAPCAGLRELAQDCDLLLMHTLLPIVEPTSHHAQVHATAQTAADLAAEARAKRLLLSHRYWESPDPATREAARAHPDVALARDRETYALVTRSGA